MLRQNETVIHLKSFVIKRKITCCSSKSVKTHSQPLHHVLFDLTVCWNVKDQASGQVCFVVTHEHIFILDILQHQELQEAKTKEEIRVGIWWKWKGKRENGPKGSVKGSRQSKLSPVGTQNRDSPPLWVWAQSPLSWVSCWEEFSSAACHSSLPAAQDTLTRAEFSCPYCMEDIHTFSYKPQPIDRPCTDNPVFQFWAIMLGHSTFTRTKQTAPASHPFCFIGSSNLKIAASLTTAL